MNFFSQILGTLTFRRSTISEIAESEDLTIKGWVLLTVSSIIAGLWISVYYLGETVISLENLIIGLVIPVLFCFFFGFDLAWIVVVVKKKYSIRSFLSIDGLRGLREPDFQRSIRIMGYSSIVLLFSGIILLTELKFYQLEEIFHPFTGEGFLDFPTFLDPFVFPFIMFLNPLDTPIVFFLIWQTILFIYSYNINIEESKGRNILGIILGLIIFNFFWTIALIAVFIAVFLLVISVASQGACIYCLPGSNKKSSTDKSSSHQQIIIKDE